MADRLFVRYFPESDHLQWLMFGHDGNVRLRGDGTPEAFVERTTDVTWTGRVRAMLPGETALLTSAEVPSRQRRQIEQAVPFMVEDDLAVEVDNLHFAIGDRLDDGTISVVAVDRELLERTLTRLNDAGLAPEALKLDTLCVPFSGDTTVVIEQGRVHLRTGPVSGLSLETALAGTALELLPEGQVNVVTCADGGEAGQVLAAQRRAELDGEAEVSTSESGGLDLLCEYYSSSSLDLLQGEYEVEGQGDDEGGGWSLVWKLGVAVFILQLLLVAGEGLYLDTLAEQYDADIKALYSNTFPNDRNVRDIRRRWEQKLRGSTGESEGFLPVFGEAAQHLRSSSLGLQNVNYNESRGDLILQLNAQRSEQLVSLSQALAEAGFSAKIGTINQSPDDEVKGSITVSKR